MKFLDLFDRDPALSPTALTVVAAAVLSCLDGGALAAVLELERLGVVGVVAARGLALVDLPDEVVDGEHVEVLAEEVEHEPVADLLGKGEAVRLQDGLDVGPLRRFASLDG